MTRRTAKRTTAASSSRSRELPDALPRPLSRAELIEQLLVMRVFVVAMLLSRVLVVSADAPPAAAAGTCVIVAPLSGGAGTTVGGADCDRRTLPASTFKIPHAL